MILTSLLAFALSFSNPTPSTGTYDFTSHISASEECPVLIMNDVNGRTYFVDTSVTFDADFNGCPYCEAKQFYICHNCGKVACYHNESYFVCPHCNESADCIGAVDTIELSGGCL